MSPSRLSRKQYCVIVIFFMMFGCFILLFSLYSPGNSSNPFSFNAVSKRPLAQLFSKEILPGNPFYIMRMLKDRVVLISTVDIEKKIRLMLSYSQERMVTANMLFEKQEHLSTINTAKKAEIYMGTALELLSKKQLSAQTEQTLYVQSKNLLILHHQQFMQYREHFSDSEKAQLDSILQYTESLQSVVSGHIQ